MKIKPGTVVQFDDGKGGKLTGTVFRVWGRKQDHVSIRTDEAKSRTFMRYMDSVRPR